jgi:HEAT repeat protein
MKRWTMAATLMASLTGCAAKEDPRYTVPGLIQMLKEKNPDDRCTAAQVLGSYGAEAKSALPALRVGLKDESESVRVCVVYGIAEIGPAAEEAISDLKEALLKDPSKDVRLGAVYALTTMGQRLAPKTVPVLRAALGSEKDPDVRTAISDATQDIGRQIVNQRKARSKRP